MTRRKSIIGALALCVLSICAFGAANASAAGLTAVTCENLGEGHKFADSHCENETGGNWETVAIKELQTTEASGVAEGNSVLIGTAFGNKTEIICEAATTEGHVTNTLEGSVHRVHGTKAVTSYSKCYAKLASSGAGERCKVESISGTAGKIGEIFTAALTSTNIGTEHEIKFEVEGGVGNVAEFNILKEATEAGKTCAIPKVKVTVTGSVNATANTTKHSHLTFEGKGELKAFGAAATYTGTNRGFMKGEPEKTIGLETF